MKVVCLLVFLCGFTQPALAQSAYTLGPGSCVGSLKNGNLEIAHFASYRSNPFQSFFVPLSDGDVVVLQFEMLSLKSAFAVHKGELRLFEIKAVRKADSTNPFSAGLIDLSLSRSGQALELRDLPIEMVKSELLAAKTDLPGVAVFLPQSMHASQILQEFCVVNKKR